MDQKMMRLCKIYSWDYVIWYKEGCAKNIEDYQAISEKNMAEKVEYVNDVIYKEGTINVLNYEETKLSKKKR